MSFCECWVEAITHVFVPKEDLDLDAIMKLFNINELEGDSGYGTT